MIFNQFYSIKLITIIILLLVGLWAVEQPSVSNNINQGAAGVTSSETITTNANTFGGTEASANETSESALLFYDKAILNDPIMQVEMDPLGAGLEQHVFKVREGSIGGYDSAGGACGCN